MRALGVTSSKNVEQKRLNIIIKGLFVIEGLRGESEVAAANSKRSCRR